MQHAEVVPKAKSVCGEDTGSPGSSLSLVGVAVVVFLFRAQARSTFAISTLAPRLGITNVETNIETNSMHKYCAYRVSSEVTRLKLLYCHCQHAVARAASDQKGASTDT
jgi:hypothetical protein